MSYPSIPRSAEITAGLIPSNIDMSSDHTAHGYANIVDIVKRMNKPQRNVVFHFTCLEMDNDPGDLNYSLAKDLVFWIAKGAER